MTTKTKIMIGVIAIWSLSALWALVTGNTSEEAALKNKFTDLCEEAFNKMEGTIANNFMMMALEYQDVNRKKNYPLKFEVEYDNDIKPLVEAKRGIDRRELNLSCQQKLVSNYSDVDPVAVIMIHIDKNGRSSHKLTDYDVYNTQDKVWWSEL